MQNKKIDMSSLIMTILTNRKDAIPKNLESSKQVIKFNIPETKHSYVRGNGEGCWGYIENETLDQYSDGIGDFDVILLNDSCYHPDLTYGTVVVVEGRGKTFRPVVKWDWLQAASMKEL